MAMGDKVKHAGEEAAGKVKEAAGKVTGNDRSNRTVGRVGQRPTRRPRESPSRRPS